MDIQWDILDEKRKKVLPLFKTLENEGFYLAGGTGLALQMGHRDSIDFDFFSREKFDTEKLFQLLVPSFKDHKILKVQEEKNTLSVIIDETIKLSFLSYEYELLRPTVDTEYFQIASIADIACMKCSAITSRCAMKDYVDLYFILKTMPLRELLALCSVKFQNVDTGLILKSLVYFEDIDSEPILYKEGHELPFESVKSFLKKQVSQFF